MASMALQIELCNQWLQVECKWKGNGSRQVDHYKYIVRPTSTCLRMCMLHFCIANVHVTRMWIRPYTLKYFTALRKMGIHPVLINWIANVLTERRQQKTICSICSLEIGSQSDA